MRFGAFGLKLRPVLRAGRLLLPRGSTELAKVAGRFGGIYIFAHRANETSHVVVQREGNQLSIGERGGLPTQVTHHKLSAAATGARVSRRCSSIETAPARRGRNPVDEYAYTASSTSNIRSRCCPAWAQARRSRACAHRLKNPPRGRIIKSETVADHSARSGEEGDPGTLVVGRCEWNASCGKNLTEITQLSWKAPTARERPRKAGIWLLNQGTARASFQRDQ